MKESEIMGNNGDFLRKKWERDEKMPFHKVYIVGRRNQIVCLLALNGCVFLLLLVQNGVFYGCHRFVSNFVMSKCLGQHDLCMSASA